ncbi:vacuolar amino acid permease [Pseudohyphozyma bogoriensis]|nr:vacuolar amino acid permease [Pseudohyphozyma bogoriensis]
MSNSGTTDERTPLLNAAAPASASPAPPAALVDPQTLSPAVRRGVLLAVWLGVFLGTSYLLTTACFTPLYGRLSNVLGRRGALLLALGLFGSGTALCAFAPTMEALIGGRLIAGMGGGGMMAMSSIITTDFIPLKERAFYQGLVNTFFGVGAGLGGPTGGLVADSIGWRWAFIIQLPPLMVVCFFVFTLVRYEVPSQGKSKSDMLRRIDFAGSIALTLSLGSLLIALSNKYNDNIPWESPFVWFPTALSGVSTVAFLLIEGLWAKEPVLPLRLLTERNAGFLSITHFLLSFAACSMLYFYPMYFEVVKGQSAGRAGAHLLPNSIIASVGSLTAGWLIRHTGTYYRLLVISGFLPIIAAVGMALMRDDTPEVLQWVVILGSGFGTSAVLTAALTALIASVDRAEMPVVTATSYLFRYCGQVVGVGASSAVLQLIVTKQLRRSITGPDAEEIIERIRSVTSSIPTLPPKLQKAAVAAYAKGLQGVFILVAAASVICWISVMPIESYTLAASFEEENKARNERNVMRTGEEVEP